MAPPRRSASPTAGRAFRRTFCRGCSSRSPRGKKRDWGWACSCRSASSRSTAGPSPAPTRPAAARGSAGRSSWGGRREGRSGGGPADMLTILVIDDEPVIQHAFRKAFHAPGYETISARTAADGLARLAARRPDVVVLDVHLPDSDGL